MKKADIIEAILGDRLRKIPQPITVKSFAPANIALCKYWGKRDQVLNLPETSSLSISLAGKGSTTVIKAIADTHDLVVFNGKPVDLASPFGRRLFEFLDLFRVQHPVHFHMDLTSTIPLAAGLASSASGFASLVLALNQLYDWQLSPKSLSILARLGSGSACRSLWDGFVEWEAGHESNGMDSYGRKLPHVWSELCVGLLIVNAGEKTMSSREAMQRTKMSSSLYSSWPAKVREDLQAIKKAIEDRDFALLGKTAESNAMTMHAMMLSAWPPISYFQPETIAAMQHIWQLRQAGLPLYFTQDAGPNLKLLFLQKEWETVKSQFTNIEIVRPFALRQ
jgi:diphosphomevalonate decarboxylase